MSVRAFYDVSAPAKLNLFLHIVGRRADGYHLLQSLFVLIDWCDTLHFERRDDGRLSRRDLGAPLPTDDLCLRAARALQSASGCRMGADISIDKDIPWGAGMGGGSSDAASTLLVLNRLWGLHWPRARLLELGLRLGADVPFFLGGRNALVEGIGEQLSPVEWPRQWLAVVKPPASIETRAIFNSPLLKRDSQAVILTGSSQSGQVCPTWIQALVESGRNDLQAVAMVQSEQVAEALDVLNRRFGNSRMTGSGSAVFSTAGWVEGSGARPDWTPKDWTPEGWTLEGWTPETGGSGWAGRMCQSLKSHPLLDWADD